MTHRPAVHQRQPGVPDRQQVAVDDRLWRLGLLELLGDLPALASQPVAQAVSGLLVARWSASEMPSQGLDQFPAARASSSASSAARSRATTRMKSSRFAQVGSASIRSAVAVDQTSGCPPTVTFWTPAQSAWATA